MARKNWLDSPNMPQLIMSRDKSLPFPMPTISSLARQQAWKMYRAHKFLLELHDIDGNMKPIRFGPAPESETTLKLARQHVGY